MFVPKRIFLLIISTLLGVGSSYAEGPTMLLELDESTDLIHLSDVNLPNNLVERRGRLTRVSNYFENHFIYSPEGYISVPQNSEVAPFPDYPRRSLQKNYTVGHTEKFSAQVKFSAFGSEISAGPTISFSRNYSVITSIIATSTKGLLILNEETGALRLDHSKKMRVSCSITATAKSNLEGSAGIKLFGLGSDVSGESSDSITVTQESTPFYLPKLNNDGEETTYQNVTDWCENVFYRLNKESVDSELSLIASQLIYKNERNECESDMDCYDWFEGLKEQAESSFSIVSREILDAVPRCVTKTNERNPYNKCIVRKTEGQKCNPRSAAWDVNHCDKKLECVVVKKAGLFSSEVARCQ